jgi:hypothetical protein
MGIDLEVMASRFRERRGEFLPTATLRFDRDSGLFGQLDLQSGPCLVRPIPSPAPKRRRTERPKSVPRFRYVSPPGATAARSLILATLALPAPDTGAHEPPKSALDWLTRTLKFLPADERRGPAVVQRLERLMYHPDTGVRATAIDRIGRSGNRSFLPRLQAIATNASELPEIRSAAAFALGLLGSPESFPTLAALLNEPGDAGRWARRAAFLLLNSLENDSALWLLGELGVENPVAVIAVARKCTVNEGTIAERLTKGLLLEQRATGRWSEEDIRLLVCIMAVTGSAVNARGRRVNVAAIAKYAARTLRGKRPVTPIPRGWSLSAGEPGPEAYKGRTGRGMALRLTLPRRRASRTSQKKLA